MERSEKLEKLYSLIDDAAELADELGAVDITLMLRDLKLDVRDEIKLEQRG